MKQQTLNILLLSFLALTMSACDEEPLTENNTETSPSPPAVEVSEPVESEYERELYTFNEKTVLKEDLFIRARQVHFKTGAVLKINQFKLSIEAETVNFEHNTRLLAYFDDEYAACKSNGSDAGDSTGLQYTDQVLVQSIEGVDKLKIMRNNSIVETTDTRLRGELGVKLFLSSEDGSGYELIIQHHKGMQYVKVVPTPDTGIWTEVE